MIVLRHRFLDLKLRHTFRIARGAADARRNVLVEIEEDGQVGRGEAAPIRRYHEDPESAAASLDMMAGRLSDTEAFAQGAARAAVQGQRSAEAAVDMALHDLAGRRLGAPLYEVLGLNPRATPRDLFHHRPRRAGGGRPEGTRSGGLPDLEGEDGIRRRQGSADGRA